jgi:uncharacterized protein (TIGR02646 family)
MVHFEKSQPAPACLAIEKAKKSGTYRCREVGERLRSDFKNKCYLCEFLAPTSINVEHFVPHRSKNPDLKFDWDNLFFCCGHCNGTKLAKPKYDDILNCTKVEESPDRHIGFRLSGIDATPAFAAITVTQRVQNTVDLLAEIHQADTMIRKLEAENLVAWLQKEVKKFYKWIEQWFDATGEEREQYRLKIISHLQSTSAFTAFKRWIIRDNDILLAEFGSEF